MTPTIKIIFLVFCLNFGILYAQEVDYGPFYYSEFEPVELNVVSADRLEHLYKEYEAKTERDEFRKIGQKYFVYKYNYSLDRLNRSGDVFFGDSISSYLNKLKDYLLRDSKYAEKIKVYLIDYSSFNAFTNDFGNVYVNIASIARIDYEEELLTLLSHEIAHVILRHSIKTEEYERKHYYENWGLDHIERQFIKHSFSRDQELEADSLALELLKGKIDLRFGTSLFSKLKNCDNPIFGGPISLDLLTGNDKALYYELSDYWKKHELEKVFYPLEREDEDTMSTHPSVDRRIAQWNNFRETLSDPETSYLPIKTYSNYKFLACRLMINTYINDDRYIEALDLILKLRGRHPNDSHLKKEQIRVLTLLSQSKYFESESDRILNRYGNSCNDINYLRFRKLFMRLNPLDLNVLTYRVQKSFEIDDKFLFNSAIRKNFCVLYKMNQNLFEKDSNGRYQYVAAFDQNQVAKENLGTDESTFLNRLKSKGFYFVSQDTSCFFVEPFVRTVQLDSSEITWIAYTDGIAENNSKQMMNIIGSTLIHPALASRKYRQGVYYKSEHFDPDKKASLFQFDNVYLKSRNESYFFPDYEKSLSLEKQVIELNSKYNLYFRDYSNVNALNLTVKDNYLHKIIRYWILERSKLGILHYSKNEADFERYIRASGTDYLVYNICYANKNLGAGRMFNLNYYEFYFDIEKQELVYMGKLGSVSSTKKEYIENCIYQSLNARQNE